MDASERIEDPPSNFRGSTTLSDALLKLSFDERNRIEEEIHGVRCGAVDETPELIQESLEKFDAQLNDKKEQHPGITVLRNVVRMYGSPAKANGCYLNDPDVRIRFLRCECFVIEKAVEKLINFLESMSELFGEFVADRPVRCTDFTAEENKALKRSRAQYLPFRDRGGRRVFVQVGNLNYHLQMNVRLKIRMYQHWVVSKDVETQRKGVVFHSHQFDEGPDFGWENELYPKLTKKDKDLNMNAFYCMPVRTVANNVYFKDTPFMRFMATAYTYNLAPDRRKITKIHFGEQTEILYKMATFGVPVDVMPISSSGSIKFNNHCAWLDAIKNTDNSTTCERKVVDCPLVNDVIFRKGSSQKYNPGNEYYMEVIRSYVQDHQLAETNKQKTEITKLVYDDIVQGRNGRFLEWWDKGKTWAVIEDPAAARKRIAKTFKGVKQKRKRESPAKELEKTVGIARSIEETNVIPVPKRIPNPAANPVPCPDPIPVSALQEYYTMAHPSKRVKTDCACFASPVEDSDEGSNSCFGRNFFPV